MLEELAVDRDLRSPRSQSKHTKQPGLGAAPISLPHLPNLTAIKCITEVQLGIGCSRGGVRVSTSPDASPHRSGPVTGSGELSSMFRSTAQLATPIRTHLPCESSCRAGEQCTGEQCTGGQCMGEYCAGVDLKPCGAQRPTSYS